MPPHRRVAHICQNTSPKRVPHISILRCGLPMTPSPSTQVSNARPWGTLISLNSDLGHPPLTPYEYLCKCWQNDPNRFTLDPTHQMPGLYT